MSRAQTIGIAICLSLVVAGTAFNSGPLILFGMMVACMFLPDAYER